MMKKVLMIAHQFPPMGGAGVQRTTKFVKYLRTFGWEPVVFTRDVKNMALKDESLVKDIPKGIQVVRTSPWDFTQLPGLLKLGGKVLHHKILIPDTERLWQVFSKRKLSNIVKNGNFDAIYTTSYPYSDHLLGLYLKNKFPQIPWVADFRDEWTNNPYILDNPHYSLRSKIENSMEKNVLIHADCLITNTPVMMQNFVKKYPFAEEKFFVIPNGYDEADFEGLSKHKQKNEKLTFTYTGSFYKRRKPDILFQALGELLRENPIQRSDLCIRLIGNFKSSTMDGLIKKYDLNEIIHVLPYMQHKECIDYLMKSDALLLIEGGGPGAEAFYTGKVFEYMNTGRPILAIIPEKGAAAQLIRSTQTGTVSDSDDVTKTKENILALYQAWKRNDNEFSPKWAEIQKFERKELTKELAVVFAEAMQRSQIARESKSEKV